jgi:hypothetical protein
MLPHEVREGVAIAVPRPLERRFILREQHRGRFQHPLRTNTMRNGDRVHRVGTGSVSGSAANFW